MVCNNILLLKRKQLSTGLYTLHYFIAVTILLVCLPQRNWWPAMTDLKLIYTVLNVFVLQGGLAAIFGLTVTHQLLALLVTILYLQVTVRIWFNSESFEIYSLNEWDTCLHSVLPVVYAVGLAILAILDRHMIE